MSDSDSEHASATPLPQTSRRVARSAFGQVLPWILSVFFGGVAYWIIARSCAYDHRAILGYASYVVLYVLLPGCLVLWSFGPQNKSMAEAIALGLPLGFAVEILTYLSSAALGLRAWYPWVIVAWVGWLLVICRDMKGRQGRLSRVAGEKRWIGCGLIGVFAVMIVIAAGHMYAAAPLSQGRLSDVTFADWVYLLSQATEIRLRWPLQDPALAGMPLSYHYFLLVHVAAASQVTGAELAQILLRFTVLPLSGALLMQGYVLGRMLARNSRVGVLVGVLLFLAEEVSFWPLPGAGTFFDLFTTWLYISPTYFFGMVFFGALVIVLPGLQKNDVRRKASLVVLVLLAVGASGAKGTVMPSLLAAYAAWITYMAVRTRRFPWNEVLWLGVMALSFGVVYLLMLKHWGTGAAHYGTLVSTSLGQFWIEHRLVWQRVLMTLGLSPVIGSGLAQGACLAIALAGAQGVRLLGLTMLFGSRRLSNPSLISWLGFVYLANFVLGEFLVLDSNGQLYLYFTTRIPAAVLAAGALTSSWPNWVSAWQAMGSILKIACRRLVGMAWHGARVYWRVMLNMAAGVFFGISVWRGLMTWWVGGGACAAVLLIVGPRSRLEIERNSVCRPRLSANWLHQALYNTSRCVPSFVVGLILFIQINHARLRNQTGLDIWWRTAGNTVDPRFDSLAAGLDWARRHTPVNAVFMANAFIPEHLSSAHLALVDRTTADKYYYYSALTERRLWLEGPAYAYDQQEVERRLQMAARLFSRRGMPSLQRAGDTPLYLLVDHSIQNRMPASLSQSWRVFQNERISIFRLPPDI